MSHKKDINLCSIQCLGEKKTFGFCKTSFVIFRGVVMVVKKTKKTRKPHYREGVIVFLMKRKNPF